MKLLKPHSFSILILVLLSYSANSSTIPTVSITCPPEVIVGTDNNLCIATNVNIGVATTGGDPGEIVSNDAPSTYPLGITVVTWTVTDGTNTATCTQNVIVRDNEAPQIPDRLTWDNLQIVSNVSNPTENSAYGVVMSIDGDYAVVGARQAGGSGQGEAYILEKNTGTGEWSELQEITGSAVTQNSFYGKSVNIKGDLAIVGADVHETDEYGEGIVYIWERNGSGTWIEIAELLASDRANRDWFGNAVAIDGDFALIGAFGEDDFGSGSGAVYAFERDEGGVWSETQKFCSADCTAGDGFGSSILMKGDTAIISAPNEDVVVQNEGAAYVFVKDGLGEWSQIQKLTYDDSPPNEGIGPNMAMDGNYFVIGYGEYDTEATNVGAAVVYKKNASGAYEQDQLLVAPDGNYKDFLGNRGVAIKNDIIALGSQDETAHYNNGAVYTFELSSDGDWTYTDKLLPTSTNHHLFGTAIGFYEDDKVLVGAPSFASTASAENAVYYIEAELANTLVDVNLGCQEVVEAPILEDNCAGPITGTTSDDLPTDVVGQYSVTWDFNDGNGNLSSYSQLVNIYDAIAPSLTCADVTVTVDPDASFQLTDADLGISYSDACSDVTVLTQPNIWITCSDVGTQNYIIQVEDDAGNRSDCVGTVTTLNASDTVQNLNNSGSNSLRDLVNDGCAGDTLYFDESLAGGTITLGSEIDITKSKVIVGLGENDLTIDGINRYRIFHITSDDLDVYLSGMKLINGNWEVQGGAILNEGDLYLSDMIFINNRQVTDFISWTNLKHVEIKSGTVDIRK